MPLGRTFLRRQPVRYALRYPPLTAIKALLYQGMREHGIGKAELARRLGWHLPQVDRVLDVHHSSRLDRMDLALSAIGLQLEVRARETALKCSVEGHKRRDWVYKRTIASWYWAPPKS
ncbi:MAG: hypothetical protein OXC69_08035 [Candidatus Tectomicrobia bacterium]|nr:hypothetical protein [Candidatus Tectomicrobia bacterium]